MAHLPWRRGWRGEGVQEEILYFFSGFGSCEAGTAFCSPPPIPRAPPPAIHTPSACPLGPAPHPAQSVSVFLGTQVCRAPLSVPGGKVGLGFALSGSVPGCRPSPAAGLPAPGSGRAGSVSSRPRRGWRWGGVCFNAETLIISSVGLPRPLPPQVSCRPHSYSPES